MHRDLSDSDLIIRSINAPGVFSELSARHGLAVHDYLRKRSGPGTADRLMLKTFALAFRDRERYQPRSSDARSWFLGIATELLRRGRRKSVPWGHDRRGQTQEQRDRLDDQALAGLSEIDRDLVCLSTIGGLNSVEVARAIGRPAAQVEKRLELLEARIHPMRSGTSRPHAARSLRQRARRDVERP